MQLLLSRVNTALKLTFSDSASSRVAKAVSVLLESV